MIDLKTHIEEALFSKKGIDAEKSAKSLELDFLKEISYNTIDDDIKPASPWEMGRVFINDDGINVFYHRQDTLNLKYPEFYLDFKNKPYKLPLFKKICTYEDKLAEHDGTLIIEQWPEKDFEKLFAKDCEINVGEIWVRHCKNLKSLKGWPKNTKSFNFLVTDCPKLHDIYELPASPYVQIDYTAVDVESFKKISKDAQNNINKLNIYKCGRMTYDEENVVRQLFKNCIVTVFE